MNDLEKFYYFIKELEQYDDEIFENFTEEELTILESILEDFCTDQEYLDEALTPRNVARYGKAISKSVLGKVQKAVSKGNRVNTAKSFAKSVATAPFKAIGGAYKWNRNLPHFKTLDDLVDFYGGKAKQLKQRFDQNRERGRVERRITSKLNKLDRIDKLDKLGLSPEKVRRANAGLNKAVFLKKRSTPTSDSSIDNKPKNEPSAWQKQKAENPNQADMFGANPKRMPKSKSSKGGMTKEKLMNKIAKPKIRIKSSAVPVNPVETPAQIPALKPKIRIKSSAVPVKPVENTPEVSQTPKKGQQTLPGFEKPETPKKSKQTRLPGF